MGNNPYALGEELQPTKEEKLAIRMKDAEVEKETIAIIIRDCGVYKFEKGARQRRSESGAGQVDFNP